LAFKAIVGIGCIDHTDSGTGQNLRSHKIASFPSSKISSHLTESSGGCYGREYNG
jgi:hypothetical protein